MSRDIILVIAGLVIGFGAAIAMDLVGLFVDGLAWAWNRIRSYREPTQPK